MNRIIQHLREPSVPSPARRAAGFTLVELLITLALVIMLIAGVNAVFRATTQTIGTGNAVAEAVRSHRGLERTLARDVESMVSLSHQMPCLLIFSQAQPAFRDREEMMRDGDYNPNASLTDREIALRTMDLNGDGTESLGEILSPLTYNDRNHRLDRLAFFSRDANNPFPRQTGDQTRPASYPKNSPLPLPLITQDSSAEAWIWYGHLRLPQRNAPLDPRLYVNGNGGHFNPGQESFTLNTGNFFSSDWAFGRVALLLKPYINSGDVIDKSNQTYPFAPLVAGSPVIATSGDKTGSLNAPTGNWLVEHSRIDVANTSIQDYRGLLNRNAALSSTLVNLFDYRFNCKPWTDRGAATETARLEHLTRETALTAPFLQNGVSHFIVEFAGDYLTQNPVTGNAIDTNGDGYFLDPDGEIDFVYTGIGTARVRSIRWYGMPRDIDKSDSVADSVPAGVPYIKRTAPLPVRAERIVDVVPVADLVRDKDGKLPNLPGGWFELFGRRNPVTGAWTTPLPGSLSAPDYVAAVPDTFCTYACAWTPIQLQNGWGPRMLRIIVTQSDPNGRMPDGQTAEYVFTLPK